MGVVQSAVGGRGAGGVSGIGLLARPAPVALAGEDAEPEEIIGPAGPLGEAHGVTADVLDGTIRAGPTLLARARPGAAEEGDADVYNLGGAAEVEPDLDDQIDVKAPLQSRQAAAGHIVDDQGPPGVDRVAPEDGPQVVPPLGRAPRAEAA